MADEEDLTISFEDGTSAVPSAKAVHGTDGGNRYVAYRVPDVMMGGAERAGSGAPIR